jgi:P4 family phage/plasmid primase-like protien
LSTNVKNIDEFRDKVISGNNKADLLEEVKENNRYSNKTHKYQIVTMSNEEWFRITSNGRSFLSEIFSDYICKHYKIYNCEGNLYIYDSGYYKNISKSALESLIEKTFRKLEYTDFKTNWTNETIQRIESKTYISLDKFDSIFNIYENIINVKNGIIKFDFKTGEFEFLKHDEKYKITIQLDVEYNPDCKNLFNWDKFLSTSLNTDKERMFLQEIGGYSLINHLNNNGQNIYCLHGEGGNGKGTFRRILNSILGSRNYTDCKASQLTNSDKQNQFFGFQFKNKLLLGTTETNYDFKDFSLLKALSGGDRQSIEMKGTNELNDYFFNGKIILSTNNKIKIYDTSKGTKRRIKFLEMDNDIKNTISDLDKRLSSEKESIFVWFLDGLKRLIKNNFIHILPDSHYEIFNMYMEHSNNFLRFVRNHIKIGKAIMKTEIFKLFQEQYGNIYRNKDELYLNFEKELKNENINFEVRRYNGVKSFFDGQEKNTTAYIGIEYVEHKEEEYKEENTNINPSTSIDHNVVLDYIRNCIHDEKIGEIEIELKNWKSNKKTNRGDLHNIVESNINKEFELIKDTTELEEIKKIPPQSSHCEDVFYLDLNNFSLVKTDNYKDVNKIYVQNNKIIVPDVNNTLLKMDIASNYLKHKLKTGMSFDEAKNVLNSTI